MEQILQLLKIIEVDQPGSCSRFIDSVTEYRHTHSAQRNIQGDRVSRGSSSRLSQLRIIPTLRPCSIATLPILCSASRLYFANALLSLNLSPYFKNSIGAPQNAVANAARIVVALFAPIPSYIWFANNGKLPLTTALTNAREANAEAEKMVYESVM